MNIQTTTALPRRQEFVAVAYVSEEWQPSKPWVGRRIQTCVRQGCTGVRRSNRAPSFCPRPRLRKASAVPLQARSRHEGLHRPPHPEEAHHRNSQQYRKEQRRGLGPYAVPTRGFNAERSSTLSF